MKFSRSNVKHVTNVSRMGQVPKLKVGEMLIMAEDDYMLDSEIVPYTNKNNKTKWVMNIPPETRGSYRSCPGGTDLMQLGITIPLWADLHIRPSIHNGAVEAEFNISRERDNQLAGMIDPFMFDQTGPCPFTERRNPKVGKAQYLKLVNPFMFKTPRGYSTLITGSMLNPQPEFDIIPGVVNTDYYHTCNVVVNVLTDKEFIIERGTPIAQMIVFKRKDNIKTLYMGDHTVTHLHRRLGFGGVWQLGKWKRAKYKKEQYKWDNQQ